MINLYIIQINLFSKPSQNFQRVSETQFLIQISDVEHANHIVVYMTGESIYLTHNRIKNINYNF